MQQGSVEWLLARRGCLSASRIADAMAVLKTGKPSEKRQKLMLELLAERLTGTLTEHYVTASMQWGIDHEQEARAAFEAVSGTLVEQVGFILHPTINGFGASPDGVVDDNTLIEIKCPNTATHIQWLIDDVVPEQHKPQMLAQMSCCNKSACVFVSYDPRLPENIRLFIKVFRPTLVEMEEVEKAAIKFVAELEELETKLLERKEMTW